MVNRAASPFGAICYALVGGASAARVRVLAPSPKYSSRPPEVKLHVGEGADISTRGACAPQTACRLVSNFLLA
jgi:hypothetical protein